MTSIEVAVDPPYPVLVGSGVVARAAELVTQETVAVVSDSNVGPVWGLEVAEALRRAGRRVLVLEVAAGEDSKELGEYGRLLGELAKAGLGRGSAVVAVGGGVVSDLAGFVAATYMRGVAFHVFPTSLLAMVDAGVGGKTGVNLAEGKNLVGAFWQPRSVAVEIGALATLPEARFREGAVELFKHGLLADDSLLAAIDDPAFAPGGDPAILESYVARSIAVKANVVAADERESGSRAHLNLGHTLAHALEAVSRHAIGHGDAVAYGLLYAGIICRERGWHDFTGDAHRLLEWLRPAPLPCRDFDALLPFIRRDKKNVDGSQRYVLLQGPSRPVTVSDVSLEEQRRAWEILLEVTT